MERLRYTKKPSAGHACALREAQANFPKAPGPPQGWAPEIQSRWDKKPQEKIAFFLLVHFSPQTLKKHLLRPRSHAQGWGVMTSQRQEAPQENAPVYKAGWEASGGGRTLSVTRGPERWERQVGALSDFTI